jgi:hypothetical protein
LDTPTFGSAAALLVSAVIYSFWSPGPPPQTVSDHMSAQAGSESEPRAGHERGFVPPAQSALLAGFDPSRTPPVNAFAVAVPSATPEQMHLQAAAIDSHAASYEFPEGRALMHWIAYLEFRQAAARTQPGR